MSLGEVLSLAIFTVFAENVVLVQLLGVSPLLDHSEKMGPALGMGGVTTVLMGLTCLCTWAVNTYLLIPFGLDRYLQVLVFLLIILILIRLTELFLKQVLPTLYTALASGIPLIVINCAVLGVALLSTRKELGALASTAYGIFGGLGFMLATVLLASLRERLAFSECPKAFEGLPIALVTAGLLAMAFMGFSGLRLPLG